MEAHVTSYVLNVPRINRWASFNSVSCRSILRRFDATAGMIKTEVGGVDIKDGASDNSLIEKITESFQAYGFEGTSL
jgi:hypothetical protein